MPTVHNGGRVEGWYIGSDQRISITLTDDDDVAITNATVTATMKDTVLAAVTGLSGVTLTHIAAGLYEGTLPDTGMANLTRGTEYWLDITATSGSNVLTQRQQGIAKYAGG